MEHDCMDTYRQEDWEAVEAHIQTYFGPCESVFHEIFSPDIHVDLYIIPPRPDHNYYTLVTFGMGVYRMNVPEELSEQKLERAEILVNLPPDWKLGEQDEAWYWPLRWLKILARLPLQEDSWLGWGHSICNSGTAPFAENTQLCGVMLMEPQDVDEEAVCCPLPNGEEINFYQMLPLYEDEMEFKLAHGAEALLDRFSPSLLTVLDPQRPNVLRNSRNLS